MWLYNSHWFVTLSCMLTHPGHAPIPSVILLWRCWSHLPGPQCLTLTWKRPTSSSDPTSLRQWKSVRKLWNVIIIRTCILTKEPFRWGREKSLFGATTPKQETHWTMHDLLNAKMSLEVWRGNWGRIASVHPSPASNRIPEHFGNMPVPDSTLEQELRTYRTVVENLQWATRQKLMFSASFSAAYSRKRIHVPCHQRPTRRC